MTAHINTNGDFLCLLIFNAYQTSDKSLRDNRCASGRSLKAFGTQGVCQAEQAAGRVTCGRPNTDTQEDK